MQDHTQNIDVREQEKFDSLADEWWDPNGKLRTLHHINPVRLQFIEKNALLHDRKVLDIGCGGGLLTESLAQKQAVVTGLDISEQAVAVARDHSEHNGLTIEYVNSNAEAYALDHAAEFDIITCMELLEHVPDVSSLLGACSKLLKPGGDLFLATINRSVKSYLSAIFAAEYVLGLLPRGTHDYARFIKPSELNNWLIQNGFQLRTLAGMRYLPVLNSCFLNSDPSVNYLAHAQLSG